MPTQTPEQIHQRRWWILAVLCLSLLIVFIGNSSLNVTIPTLSRQLHATESQLQWLVAIYSLVFAGLLFTTGALGDRFGRKGALQLGLLIFLAGAGLASSSNGMPELIACRALMGVGAAFIMPSTLSILINVFPPHERTKAIAIWASVTGAAGGFGPVISGLLLAHFWWGAVFLINVPLLILALVAGYFLRAHLPRSRGGAARSGRRGAVHHRRGVGRLRPDRGAPERMGQPGHPRRLRRGCGAARRLRLLGAAPGRADARHRATSATPPSAPAPAA